jgi:error-prone DNA polymerase
LSGVKRARPVRLQTRRHDDKPGDPMTFVTLEDATGLFEAVFFPGAHARFAGRLTTAGPYRLDGRVTESWGAASLEVENVSSFDPAEE